jgi:murein DD-endopeptidase MepM/ murein hydrolase activator NlpD
MWLCHRTVNGFVCLHADYNDLQGPRAALPVLASARLGSRVMRPNQRPRTGRRRDDEIRVIRTETVRYPGHEHPLIDEMTEDSAGTGGGGGRSAGPDAATSTNGRPRIQVRDTGLAVEGRAMRAERARTRNRQRTTAIVVAAAVALLIAISGWKFASDRRAASLPLDASSSSSAANAPAAAHAQASKLGDMFRATTKAPNPTPIFASYGRLKLHLPVPVSKLTEIGFHQASYAWALRMKTPLKDAKASESNAHRGTSRDTSRQPTGADAVLVGKVLRMWRARPGRPDTAADVGAKPGTTVISPVTGTVVKIKSYKLYGKWPDYEMHIVPDGYDNLDIVMIHLADLEVKPGQRVIAGVTPVAHVRKLSDKFTDQLAQYVKDGGDHVHLQVNNSEYKGYKGLVGAVEPEEPPTAEEIGN